jgi:hypothetical protein
MLGLESQAFPDPGPGLRVVVKEIEFQIGVVDVVAIIALESSTGGE